MVFYIFILFFAHNGNFVFFRSGEVSESGSCFVQYVLLCLGRTSLCVTYDCRHPYCLRMWAADGTIQNEKGANDLVRVFGLGQSFCTAVF